METNTKDAFHLATAAIIAHLEQGILPWCLPWKQGQLPLNPITRKRFRGLNLWLLNSLDYPTNYFLTYQQINDVGGRVKKGEKGHLTLYWKNADEPGSKPELRHSRVFNIQQCSGLPEAEFPLITKVGDPISILDEIILSMPHRPEIRTLDDSLAYYHIDEDFVNVPRKETVEDVEDYYLNLLQALVNSTGSKGRLARRHIVERLLSGDESYSQEELVAILGASYLFGFSGLECALTNTVRGNAEKWAEIFRKDSRMVVYAACQAQRAVDYILGLDYATAAEVAASNAQ